MASSGDKAKNENSLTNNISNQILNRYDSSLALNSNTQVVNSMDINIEMRGTNIIGNNININTIQDSKLQSKMENNLTEAIAFSNALQNGLTNNMTNNTNFKRSFDTEGSANGKDCNVLSVCSPLIDLSGIMPTSALIKGATDVLKDLIKGITGGNRNPNITDTDLENIMNNKNEADSQIKTAIHSAYHFHYNNVNSNQEGLKLSLIADGDINNNTINISNKQMNQNVINTSLELIRTSQTDNNIVNDFQNALDNDLNADLKYKQRNSKNPFGVFGTLLYTALGFIGIIVVLNLVPKIIQSFNNNNNNNNNQNSSNSAENTSKGFYIINKDEDRATFRKRAICIGTITACIPLYIIFSHIIGSETRRIRQEKANILPVHDNIFIIFYTVSLVGILVASIVFCHDLYYSS